MRCAVQSLGALALIIAGCGSCGSGTEALRVDEPAPHVRCLAGDPPEEGSRSIGDVTLEIEDRELRVAGPNAPVRFAAFAGPAPGRPDLSTALATIRESEVAFVAVLGDLGDDLEAALATLSALADLGIPVFVVPGGRDDAAIVADAFDALPEDAQLRVIDASGLDRIIVAGQSLLPIAGAPGGRYARTDDACGFSGGDLEARADRLGAPEASERRYLLSWAAPAGGIAEGLAGADAGDEALAELAVAVGASGGLYAWPREAAGRVLGEGPTRSEVLRRIAGPAAVRGDGERPAPGPAFYSLGPDGLASP